MKGVGNIKKYLLVCIGYIIFQVERISRIALSYYKTYRMRKIKGTNIDHIGADVKFAHTENIYIGNNSYINGGDIIASKNAKIIIGSNCMISYNVHIRTDMHIHKSTEIQMIKQGLSEKDIIIGDDVWIGYGAQIMSGVTIGNGVIIGAGAVVTKNIEPYMVACGVPAKVIKTRL